MSKDTSVTMPPDPTALQSTAAGLARRWGDTLVDFRIKFGEREWKVHKLVLAVHSPVLAAACIQNFLEVSHGVIDLSEEDSQCVDMLISYFYNLNYDHGLDDRSDNPFYFHVQMCIVADKYDVPPLKVLAEEEFKWQVENTMWKGLNEAVLLAYEFPEVTKAIREYLINSVIERNLLQFASKNPGSSIERLMRECADLATDVAMTQRTYKVDEKRYHCPDCAATFVAAIPKYGPEFVFWYFQCGASQYREGWEECIEHVA